MMQQPKTALLVAAALVLSLLAGCASQADLPASGGIASGTPPGSADATAPASPTASATPSPTPTATPTPTPSPTATPVKLLYSMSKAYRFVPIAKETTDKVVLLTFDDGPKADETTSSLLDTLDKHHAKAIFFVNGYLVKQHPELLQKIAARGQTIGNHSWDHIDLKKETEEKIEQQIGDVSKIVKETIGVSPKFFRPPYGSGGDKVRKIANGHGMLYTTWSNGSLDWDTSATKKQPGLVIQNVLDQLHPGANILMHELPWTAEALDSLLTKLEEKGYGFIDPATIDLGLDAATPSAT